MGCCSCKDVSAISARLRGARPNPMSGREDRGSRSEPSPSVPANTIGRTESEAEARAARLAAAEKRAEDQRNRGLGGQAPGKGKELEDAAVRQDLLGRIEAHYKDRKMDMPIGLGSSKVTVEQLRDHYKAISRKKPGDEAKIDLVIEDEY